VVPGRDADVSVHAGLLWPQTGSLWAAGNMYFDNLLESALLGLEGDERITVIEPAPPGGTDAARHPGAGVATYELGPSDSRLAGLVRTARQRFGVPERAVAAAIARSGVGMVFGDANQMGRYRVPWVGWIPDFQHREAPEYFSASERDARDRAYARMSRDAALVLLSSEDARSHFERLSPEHADKARVASFVSLMAADVFAQDASSVAIRYGITGPFVVVPNQWWRHKNHEAAIRAAAILRERGSDITWVFTGALADYRDPTHISTLLQLIAQLGVSKHVIVLGMLPRDDQLQLMRAAEMVVQPSLFEGWSTVVEDAKTLGQRIVVSDLPVHREQEPGAALFFDPHSPEQLADAVAAMLDGACQRPDEETARRASIDRARIFGRRFLDICTEAAGHR